MYYTAPEIVAELMAQISKTDLGVTDTHTLTFEDGDLQTTLDSIVSPQPQGYGVFRLDNGQEFLLTVQPWDGPRS